MKKLSVLTLLFVGFLLSSCTQAPTKEEAIDFNDRIIEDQTEYLQTETVFIDALSYNFDEYSVEDTIPEEAKEAAVIELEESYNTLKSFAEEKHAEYSEMEAFDGEDIFRTAFISYLESYLELINNQYLELMEIQKYYLQELEVTDEMIVKWDDLIEEAEQTGEDIEAEFGEKQENFAAQYEFELEEQE